MAETFTNSNSPENLENNKLNNSINFNSDEFKAGVTDDFSPEKNLSGLSRRKFIGLLSASAAITAAACSDYRDKGEIIPYNQKPEEVLPGKANYYASTCDACPNACGILIKTREGRPIKIDGNPEHPINAGKICNKGQANILNLYDPSRLKEPFVIKNNSKIKKSWNEIDEQVFDILKNANGKEIALITNTIFSPSEAKMINDFIQRYPSAKIYTYDLFHEEIKNSAWKKCYGQQNFPLINWEKANVILSLEGDFLGVEGHHIEQVRHFSERRDAVKSKNFNRLYVAEGSLSLTGMNADYRFSIRPDLQLEFLLSLINEITTDKFDGYNLDSFMKNYGLKKSGIDSLVSDLKNRPASCLVYAGRNLSENVQIAVNYLNELLGNKHLFNSTQQKTTYFQFTTKSDWENFIQSVKNGNVHAVIHYDSNPVYHLPFDYNYSEIIKKIPYRIALTELENETSALCNYILPISHTLESWGDANIRTGIFSLQQPVIAPLYNTRQKESVLLNWLNEKSNSDHVYYDYIKTYWQNNVFSLFNSLISFEHFWVTALHDGVMVANTKMNVEYKFNSNVLANLSSGQKNNDSLVVMLTESFKIGDGKFSNNGWLQELPHYASKITWDNYAAISSKTAKKLGVVNDDLIEVSIDKRKAILPVFIQPGQAEQLISVELGYGRTNSPVVAEQVGVNANILLTKNYEISPWIYKDAIVNKIDGKYKLASTVENHPLENVALTEIPFKREIIREGNVREYEKNSNFLNEGKKKEHLSMYKEYEYSELKWGMSIDLNKCIGCSACITACNVENNIPVVGKDQVDRGREMQWIRIDRYYSGTDNDLKVSQQPMMCQHCDKAPCENVCPVVATTHSSDGLNQMVYNRCVGTRYCSNNCPYKVRRFNFFNFRDHFAEGYYEQPSVELIHNPEVTVRSRGVMEKCTFCIHRIMDARSIATSEGKKLKGNEVRTACQDACPANAIQFGNINDKDSEFIKYRNHELGYSVLEELNVKPNITYLAKLRNTNTEKV